MKLFFFACCLVFSTAISTNADVARPKPQDKPARQIALHTSLEIATDAKAYEAKLQISQSELKNLRAAIDNNSGSAPVVGVIASSSPRTIVAGMLMFLALSAVGVLLARSSSFGRAQKTVAAILIVAVVLGAAAIITRGNAGPPGSWRWRNLPQSLAEGKPTTGGVDIEIVPDNEMDSRGMRLIMPLKKQTSPGEE